LLNAAYTASVSGSNSYLGDGTSGIYVWGAQLEQASTVGDYVPTTSAINSAPRFDHNPTTGESLGLLVEEARTNLLLRSEAILAANNYGANNSTLAAASIANPFGGTTASLFTLNVGANTGNNQDGFNFGSAIALANSTAHAQSLFVKPAGTTVLRLRNNALGGTHDFTLTGNGTAPSISGGLTSASIVPFPGGWYRVSWTFTTTTTTPGNRSDYWAIKTDVADGTNGLHVVGAQLEAGAFATSYIPTTSATVTRAADVASITGSNFGTTRTNLLTYSELFNASPWAPGSLSVASTTATTSPAGINTAIRFIENTVAAQFHFINYPLTKAASAIQYTVSGYGKAGERELILSAANGVTGSVARFNLATGVITAVATGYGGGFTAQGSTITPVGNGWYRFSMTFTTDTTTGLTIQFALYNTALATNVYTGDGTSGIYLWGAQLETGSAATPYIPTTTAAVSVFESSWYNQTEGTVFADVSVLSTSRVNQVISFNDGTLNNRFEFRPVGNVDTMRTDCVVSGVTKYSNVAFALTGQRRIGALAIKANDFRMQSGATGVSPASDAVPTVDRLYLNYATFANGEINGTIKRLTYWPVRLANTVLQQITL
jgi:hypothetical protein